MFKDVPPEGDTFKGSFIPPGTIIGYSVMGVCRDKNIWGEDVGVFRPERFLDGSQEELKERDAAMEGSFGFGRWKCLGRHIAMIELNKVIVEVRSI
jgi:cytochrome P450